jgi:hypothetical protein
MPQILIIKNHHCMSKEIGIGIIVFGNRILINQKIVPYNAIIVYSNSLKVFKSKKNKQKRKHLTFQVLHQNCSVTGRRIPRLRNRPAFDPTICRLDP